MVDDALGGRFVVNATSPPVPPSAEPEAPAETPRKRAKAAKAGKPGKRARSDSEPHADEADGAGGGAGAESEGLTALQLRFRLVDAGSAGALLRELTHASTHPTRHLQLRAAPAAS